MSIATGIITVSLMQQMPKSVPSTINSIIERTIEKVSTVPTPVATTSTDNKSVLPVIGDTDAIVSIYQKNEASPANPAIPTTIEQVQATQKQPSTDKIKALGQGVIISDIGLILVDTNILTDKTVYKVTLNKTDFDATILKQFTNGFTILKIGPQKSTSTDTTNKTTPPAAVPAQ